MQEGYHDSTSLPPDYQLEEFIVEYVDGTMDPAVRAVFEEYLVQDPDLADQVCEMRQVRNVMCGLGCGCVAPPGFQTRLRSRLSGEIMRETMTRLAGPPRLSRTLLFSLVAALVILGSLYPDDSSVFSDHTAQSSITIQSGDIASSPLFADSRAPNQTPSISQNRMLHAVDHSPVRHTIPVASSAVSQPEQNAGSSSGILAEKANQPYCPDHLGR